MAWTLAAARLKLRFLLPLPLNVYQGTNMEVKPMVRKELNGTQFVPGLEINGTFRPIGPSCASQTVAIRLANKRMSTIESYVAACARLAPG